MVPFSLDVFGKSKQFLLQSGTKRFRMHLLGLFEKNYYNVKTNKENFTNFQIIITKCDKKVSQSVTGNTK